MGKYEPVYSIFIRRVDVYNTQNIDIYIIFHNTLETDFSLLRKFSDTHNFVVEILWSANWYLPQTVDIRIIETYDRLAGE